MEALYDARRPRRERAGVAAAAVMVMGIAALACHPSFEHLGSIHPGGGFERWCVRLGDTVHQVTVEDLRDSISGALDRTDLVNSGDWESLDTVDFMYEGNCDSLSDAQLANVDLLYAIRDDISDTCASATNPCAQPIAPTEAHGAHVNYARYNIHINTLRMLDPVRRNHFVNHETGHGLGLADPTPVAEPPDSEHCIVDAQGRGPVPVVSIMHNPGWCHVWAAAEFPYPAQYDLSIVELVIDNHPCVAEELPEEEECW
jgi:hypothetical protein